ncbi:hypothetical protein CPT03_10120 [Pedobacter ginsengisoli]|uniref:BIG2 domain-containing protein n=1 Tax=Pedobacter ginsengisoli TaxID=363852 RepID=A0A2D1U5J7_9SPHI|nr:Ig-like domain-containing protein [Pedobacter ginsengisoli]ATP56804.1 hypothetical protein CPT03_10120 [Pedobacter ginsengisoli]
MVFGSNVKGQCFGYERKYANSENNSNVTGTFLGLGDNNDVTNPSFAVGNNLNDFSTIAIPSLGITRYQKLSFGQTFTNSEAIHVKLASSVSLSLLAVTVEIQAYNGASPSGTKVTLSSGALLNLLSGSNIADIVIPDPGATYDAVQVTIIGALLSSGSMNIYAAYVNKPQTAGINCNTIEDLITGTTSGVLGALNGVITPNNAIDGDLTSYAEIRQNVGVAGYVHLTTLFSSPSVPGDSISVLLSVPGVPLLDANVFSKLSVVAYNGNTAVATMPASSSLLGIRLLDATNHIYQFTYAVNSSFDRISVQAGGLVGALTSAYVYDIKRIVPKPSILIDGISITSKSICVGQNTTLSINIPQSCTDYKWYDAISGGNLLYTGGSFVRNSLPQGTYTYYVQSVRQGCTTTSSERIPVTITVNPLPTVGTILGNSSVCVSRTTLLSNSASGGIWTSSDITKASVNSSGFVTGIAIGSAIITYTVTDPITGCTNSDSKNITVNALPDPGMINGNTSLCVNQTITLSNLISGGTWASSDNTKASINSSGVVMGIAKGETTITYTVTNAGCSSAAVLVITVNPLPNATISGTATVCQGTAAQAITFTGSNGTSPYTFTYNINGGNSKTITTAIGDDTVSIPISTISQGTFTYNLLSVMDASSTQCSNTQTGSATVTILERPPTPHLNFTTNSQY